MNRYQGPGREKGEPNALEKKQKHIGKQTYNDNDNARVHGGESSMKPLSALRVELVENSK